jgi:hypothetical protein
MPPQEALVCSPKVLPENAWFAAAQTAMEVNPVNRPRIDHLAMAAFNFAPEPALISVLTTKYWGAKGVKLTVGFLDSAPTDLRKRILLHMNAWSQTANVSFVEAKTDPQVRIARVPDGYWSYLGTDVLHIPKNQPTMNLQGFTMNTPESEYRRVVRHETGHTLGMPHEHMRRELVDRIDVAKAIAFFGRTQGWTEQMVRQQVLTPIEEASIRGTAHSDERSIMCYQIPGIITKSGQPILGGTDIDTSDASFAGLIYPKLKTAPAKTAPPKKGFKEAVGDAVRKVKESVRRVGKAPAKKAKKATKKAAKKAAKKATKKAARKPAKAARKSSGLRRR